MNDALRDAANLMGAQQYLKAAQAYRHICETQPEHAAIAASQVGAALFFLRNFTEAIQWYEHAGRLGFDAAATQANIEEARAAMAAPYVPTVGDVMMAPHGGLIRYGEDGQWHPHTQ